MSLQEAGILRKFYYDELNPPAYVPLPRYWSGEKPIDMEMMTTPLIFMGITFFLSILAFIGEYCVGIGKRAKVC